MIDLNPDSPPLCHQQGWFASRQLPGPPPWATERIALRPPWLPGDEPPVQAEPGELEDDPELQPVPAGIGGSELEPPIIDAPAAAAPPPPATAASAAPRGYHRLGTTDLADRIGEIARRVLGTENQSLSTTEQLRFGTHGSISVEIEGAKKGTWFCHETNQGGGAVQLVAIKGGVARDCVFDWLRDELGIEIEGQKPRRRIITSYIYSDEAGKPLARKLRWEPKFFSWERADGVSGWVGGKGCMNGVRRALYRLREVKNAPPDAVIYIVEGEKDADNGAALGLVTTCNPDGGSKTKSGQPGKWRSDFSESLRGRNVVIIPDNDDVGRSHAETVANALARVGCQVRVVSVPSVHKDLSDFLAAGGTREQLEALVGEAPLHEAPPGAPEIAIARADSGLGYEHFRAYLPDHRYIHEPTGATWPAESVNAILPSLDGADGKVSPSFVLDKTRPVHQMTWLPGAPLIIPDKYVRDGGWIPHPGATVFNRYRAPTIEPGNPAGAQRWLDHGIYLYPDDWDHLVKWLAHRVQHPGQKINHAIVLGGKPGIGKDTILQPLKYGIGSWNFREITAPEAIERNNDFLQSIICLISEAREGGKKISPYQFYEQTKVFIAAPPDTLRINEKYIREYVIFNLVAIAITTNNRTNGLYLPADDRRHYVAWSLCIKEDARFKDGYFSKIYHYFANGGARDVTAYLMEYNLAGFDPKAPPPQTDAFWAIAMPAGLARMPSWLTWSTGLGSPMW